MQTINFNVTDTAVTLTSKPEIVTSGNIEYIKCVFNLSSEYENLFVRASFNGNYREVTNGECYAPILDEGVCNIGVYGYSLENDEYKLIISPQKTSIVIKKGSYNKDDVVAANPAPTEIEQFKRDLDKKLNIYQGEENVGKTVVVDEDGNLVVGEGGSGTTDYTELINKPRELLDVTEGDTVDFLDVADDKVYDVPYDFTLAKMVGDVVLTSLPVHAGDIFSVSEYNSTDGYSTISLFCNLGLYNFKSYINNWTDNGLCVNVYDMVNEFAVFKLPVEVSGQSATCDVTELADGSYIAAQAATLTGFDNDGTLNVLKNDVIKKRANSLLIDNSIITDYDLTTAVNLYQLHADIAQSTGSSTDKPMSQAATTAAVNTRVATAQGASNVGKRMGVNSIGNLTPVEAESIDFVSALPQSPDDNTNYLTRATRPTINYGDYCSNKVRYPTAALPSFASLAQRDVCILFYNSLDECFYILTCTPYGALRFNNVGTNNGYCYVYTGYTKCYVDKYDPTGAFEWTETYLGNGGTYNLFPINSTKPFKILYANSDRSFVSGDSYTITNDSTKYGEDGYIYADYFIPSTGGYTTDLDNVDDSDIFNFLVNAYRNGDWEEIGTYNLQWLTDQFAKAAALTAETTARQNADSALQTLINNKIDKPLFFVNKSVAVADWVGNTFAVETFTGDGTTTAFTLEGTVVSGTPTVKVGGTSTTDFTYASGVITFTTAPADEAEIEVTYNITPDTGFEGYDYKAVVTCSGVTADMLAEVIFYDTQSGGGYLARTANTGTDSVTIYSNDNSAITIPTIVAGAPVMVQVVEQGGSSGHNYSTTEQVVGTWIDGKPLYEKTIQKILPNETDDIANTDLTSLNIDKMISLDAYAITTSGFVLFNNANTQYYGKLSIVYRSELNSGSNAPCLSADISSTLAGQTAYITIQYTKTSDTAEVVE